MKKQLFNIICLLVCVPLGLSAFNVNTGKVGNLVCFVRFADEDADQVFQKSMSVYDNLFNGEGKDKNSVFQYFKTASYGQLEWRSTFFPQPVSDRIVSYQAKYERAYYQKYDTTLRPTGYTSDTEGEARMMALVKEIAAAVNTDEDIDVNGDGMVDNLCIIFSGQSELSNKRGILWPQRKDLALPDEKAVYIAGKKLVGYLMVFDEANGFDRDFNGIPLNTGVLCHEMSHSLGTYDLYHASGDLNPVGVWDLMSDNQAAAQGMTAYTKWRYCHWLDEIPEISEPGVYTLHPVGGDDKTNVAYKIHPVGSDEYFVVEYRRQEGFDAGLPASGLLVYRINPAYTGGNVNYNGTTRLDEQYIFRPGGTPKADGMLAQAVFSKESGRTDFGGTATSVPFYSDGTEAPFALSDISACGETLSFRLLPTADRLTLSAEELNLGGKAGSASSVSVSATTGWTCRLTEDWLKVSPADGISISDDGKTIEGAAGTVTLTFQAVSANEAATSREATLTLTALNETSLTSQLHIIQLSDALTPPADLAYTVNDEGVELKWTPASSGKTLLQDDFENTDNPNGWVIETTGDRGWRWEKGQTDKGFYRPYEGSYAATVYYAWDDVHQEESFISPSFANGTLLTFYSRSNASGATPKDPQYYNVEVSSDNGATWTPVFNVCNDQNKSMSGKYQKVSLDLTPYQSATMKIRFHCYDTNNLGLSYYWQIDNLSVTGENSDMTIEGYNVYRNGQKIATTTSPMYVDKDFVKGANVYTVAAFGSFGESSLSNTVTYDSPVSGIESVYNPMSETEMTGIYTLGGIRLTGSGQMRRGETYIVKYANGTVMKRIVK